MAPNTNDMVQITEQGDRAQVAGKENSLNDYMYVS